MKENRITSPKWGRNALNIQHVCSPTHEAMSVMPNLSNDQTESAKLKRYLDSIMRSPIREFLWLPCHVCMGHANAGFSVLVPVGPFL